MPKGKYKNYCSLQNRANRIGIIRITTNELIKTGLNRKQATTEAWQIYKDQKTDKK